MGSDKVADTYIQEKNLEREFLKKINNETDARATSWGNMMEGYAFNKLGYEYKLCSKTTIQHPMFDFWVGTPDVLKSNTVGDIKNPFTLKSFYGLAKIAPKIGLLNYYEDYYWQLVSNAILTDSQYCELIIHAPFEDEFSLIQEYFNDYENKSEMNWFTNCKPESLPMLKRESKIKDLYIISFDPDYKIKEQLTNTIINASKKLISF
jgi:hypothetical protein